MLYQIVITRFSYRITKAEKLRPSIRSLARPPTAINIPPTHSDLQAYRCLRRFHCFRCDLPGASA